MNDHGAKCTWLDILEEMEPQLGMEGSFQSIFFPTPAARDDSEQSQQTLSQQLTTIPVSQTRRNHMEAKSQNLQALPDERRKVAVFGE